MKLYCADLFCGAGGTSSGLIEAALELDLDEAARAANASREAPGVLVASRLR